MIVEALILTNGQVSRVRWEGVESYAWQPYAPGGRLFIMNDKAGRAVGGPFDGDIIKWTSAPDGSPPRLLDAPAGTRTVTMANGERKVVRFW